MKLPLKLAGLFGSGVFILTAIPGFYQQVKPASLNAMMTDAIQGMAILEKLGISLLGALVAGVLGFVIGDIFSKPRGKVKKPKPKPAKSNIPSRFLEEPKSAPVTGEETFLQDMDAAPGIPSGEATLVEES